MNSSHKYLWADAIPGLYAYSFIHPVNAYWMPAICRALCWFMNCCMQSKHKPFLMCTVIFILSRLPFPVDFKLLAGRDSCPDAWHIVGSLKFFGN